MAIELTTLAQVKSDSINQLPQMVMVIDGVPTLFGIGKISKYARIGDPDLYIDGTWKIGGLVGHYDQLDVIDLGGSSNTISQQLLQDKGGTTSVPSIQISLIDKDEAITRLITPSEIVPDILGRKASVYLGYQETSFPQDFVRIFSGMIDEVNAGSTIILNVAHPEQKKRAEIFQKITTELTSDFNYRSKRIQHISYETRRDVVGTVTVTYTTGATAGSEVVSIAGNNITVQIESGVSRATHIRNAIEKSIGALSLVDVSIDDGFTNEIQNSMASTNLDSDTTIQVKNTLGMLLPVPLEGLRTYVRIDDEVIEYTGLTSTTITGCTRAALLPQDKRAFGAIHDIGTSVDTFYRIEGQAIDLALKILMSGGDKYFATDVKIKSIGEVEDVGTIPNALYFESINIQDAWGITIGDMVSIIDDDIPANNVVDALIAEVVATSYGSYIILDAPLTSQILSTGKASFASKWNVFPKGAGLEMGGDEIDVPQFEYIRETFASSIFTYDFYLKDTMKAKDFIDTDLLFPTGSYSLPRRGKISCGYTSPPLGITELKVLDSSNTTRPEQNKVKRSINRYFYNNVLFKYNEAVVDDLLLSGDLEVNQDSKNRIPVGNKTLLLLSKGLRPSTDTDVIVELLKKRFQDKYKFAAELIQTQAFYGSTFNVDVGDIIVFGDANLNLPDTKNASRAFSPRLFEVSNKSLSIKTGEVKLDLLDSGYSLVDGRYGVISPSSQTVAIGSSGNIIKIKNSYETTAPRLEKSKWTTIIGQKVIIHDEMWDNLFETTLLGFSTSDNYAMIVKDNIPFAVLDNYVVEIAQYPDTSNSEDNVLLKRIYVFTNPTVAITSGINTTQFTINLADVSKFLIDAIVLIRDEAWDVVSPELKVTDITGATITVSASMGFTPLAGYEIDLIGYKDGGAPYRYL